MPNDTTPSDDRRQDSDDQPPTTTATRGTTLEATVHRAVEVRPVSGRAPFTVDDETTDSLQLAVRPDGVDGSGDGADERVAIECEIETTDGDTLALTVSITAGTAVDLADSAEEFGTGAGRARTEISVDDCPRATTTYDGVGDASVISPPGADARRDGFVQLDCRGDSGAAAATLSVTLSVDDTAPLASALREAAGD